VVLTKVRKILAAISSSSSYLWYDKYAITYFKMLWTKGGQP